MTSHVARLYSLAAGVLVFFVAWAAVAAHPWQTHKTAAQDPRYAALKVREHRLRAESLAVKRILDRRWATYRAQLTLRKHEIASINAANAKARATASARVGAGRGVERRRRLRPLRPRRDAAAADDHEDIVMERRTFHAMGTEVELLLDVTRSAESRDALDRVEVEFERLEALLSRFRPDSELSALNRRGVLDAGPELVEVTRLAVEARTRTAGLFDPTVHDALVAAGYDRTFDEVAPDGPAAAPRRCGGDVSLDGSRIEIERGFRLDLGGIAKGYAVDRAARMLVGTGPCLVNAGGDIACYGRRWPVGVETADGQVTLELDRGAIATSGRDRRRWRRNGAEAHHLIDPGTGTSAGGDFLRVTVVANTAVEAEVLAKAIFLGAPAAGPAVLVMNDGRTVFTGGLA